MVRTMACLAIAVSACGAASSAVESAKPIATATATATATPRRIVAPAATPPARTATASRPEPAAVVPAEPVTQAAPDPGPFWLDAGDVPVVVYPPKDHSRAQPVTVFLHGMCDVPQNECPWIAPAATEHGWLVCPRASLACQGGGAAWSFTHAGKNVESAVERLVAARPGQVDTEGRTLMGFSLGGSVAMNLAQAGDGRWAHLVVIAAKVTADKRRLDHAGVRSVVFAAGDYDMTHGSLLGATRRLDRAGFPALFVSLGKVGHTFPADMDEKMHAALGFPDAGS